MRNHNDPERWSWLPLLFAVAGVVALAVPLFDYFRHKYGPEAPTPPQGQRAPADTSPDSEAPRSGSIANSIKDRLRHAKWPEAAATAVVNLNLDWFTIQSEENPGGFERQLKLLENLGTHPSVFTVVEKRPELASLLAGVAVPDMVAASLSVPSDDYTPLAGLFLQHTATHDRVALASAINSHRSTIRLLQDRGLLGAEILFMYDRQTTGAKDWSIEYDRWLNEEINTRRHVPDDELASFVNLVISQGPTIRRRLTEDDSFRREFRPRLWPRLNRAAQSSQNMLDSYLGDPRVWDLLRLDAGEELLKTTNLLAIDLLYGYPDDDRPAYPADSHDEVIQILLRREPLSVQSLLEFRREPLFSRLLMKPITNDTRVAALAKLFQARPNHAALLSQYLRLDGSALAEEVGPPPHGLVTWLPFYYTVYEVPKKWLQGRDATMMDLLQAGLDPVMLVIDIATGGAAEVPKRALVAGGKATAEELAEKVGEKVLVVTLEKRAQDLATRKLGAEAAQRLAAKGGGMMSDWTASALLAESQHMVKGALGRAATIDVTEFVRVLHTYGGVDHRTLKNLLGIDARLYMRGDAKVFFAIHNAPRALLGTKAAEFLARTSKDLMIGGAVESEQGQDVLRKGARTAADMREQASQAMLTWQQHVSAFWLLQASGATLATAP